MYKYRVLSIIFGSFAVFTALLILLLLMGGAGTLRTPKYYGDEMVYETVNCEVIAFYDYDDVLVLKLHIIGSGRNGRFIIEGKNYEIIKNNGLIEDVHNWSRLEMITAFGYFGDAWKYPIVQLKMDDKVYLDYKDGYPNNVEEYTERSLSVKRWLLIYISILGIFAVLLQYFHRLKKNTEEIYYEKC